MKAKKLLLLAILLTLTGCSGSKKVDSSATVSEGTTSSETVVSSVSDTDDSEYYALPEGYKETYMGFSYGDSLTDIMIDRQFLVGVDQAISFSFTTPYSATSTVVSSNEKVFTVEKQTETSYILHILHAGKAYITIKDENGLVRLRHIVYASDGMSKEEMLDYLSEVDYWKAYGGYGDDYKMTFLFDNTVTISGTISGENFEAFTCGFSFSTENAEEYRYTFTGDAVKNSTSNLTGFNISKCGDIMYLQYTSGTAALMFPNTRTFD